MSKFLNLLRFRRPQMENDLERELRYHVDRRVQDMMKEGLSESEARRAANIEFGGVAQIQEDVRDAWSWRWVETLIADSQYALRTLRKNWGFSSGVVAVLALGIGATVAMFSVVNTVLLKPLDFPDAHRIVTIETRSSNTGRTSVDVSGPDFLDWRREAKSFDKSAVYSSGSGGDIATIVNDRAVFANARFVSSEFFAVFGQSPVAGRLLLETDEPAGEAGATVAVLAAHWAIAHFGSAANAIGKTINVYGDPVQIVGVARSAFRFPENADYWMPQSIESAASSRNDYSLRAVARVKAGIPVDDARMELQRIGDGLALQIPENRFMSVHVRGLQESSTASVRATLLVLMGAVFAVLLIACANISNLLLARAAVRTREIALRAALGAGRRRIVRQLLTESGVLGIVSGTLGTLLAFALVKGLVAVSPSNLPRLGDITVDSAALLFALGLTIASVAFFGLIPALQASRLDLSGVLRQGRSNGESAGGAKRARSLLVVGEVALSVMLLTAAGMLLQSFQKLQRVDLGFTTDKVVVAYMEYAVADETETQARIAFYSEILDALRATPGVSAASGVAYLGMGREVRTPRDYFVDGRDEGKAGARPQTEFHAITPDYFKTLEIAIRAGRDFSSADKFDSPPVAVINETLARQAFPGASAIGQRIRTSNKGDWLEIVGVSADTRWQEPGKLPPPVLYVSTLQGWGKSPSILVRTSIDPVSMSSTIRSLILARNPGVPVRFETMQELFADAVAHPRFRSQLIGAFAAIASLLAAVGIFSVLAYLVGLRTREIAVRRAVGAGTRDVIGLVVGQSMRLVAAGLIAGLLGSVACARLLEGLLYELSPWSAGPYVGAIVVIGVSALLAAIVPAFRAVSITPVVALQGE